MSEPKCVWCKGSVDKEEYEAYDHVHAECQFAWQDVYAKHNPNNVWTKQYLAAKEASE
jgi:hypothetical protein